MVAEFLSLAMYVSDLYCRARSLWLPQISLWQEKACQGRRWLFCKGQQQPHWVDVRFAWSLAPDRFLILHPGIRHDGKPEVLLTSEQANSVANYADLPQSSRPYTRFANDYESLSPILFHSAEELAKKLQTLSKKSTVKRVANEKDGMGRGAFEHGRYVLFFGTLLVPL